MISDERFTCDITAADRYSMQDLIPDDDRPTPAELEEPRPRPPAKPRPPAEARK